MKWDSWNRVLAVFAVAALVVHFWPIAYWSTGTMIGLRIIAAFCAQMLFCRIIRHGVVKLLPMMLTVLLALWGGCLYLTSPAWQHATFHGYIIEYCGPAISCAAAYFIYLKGGRMLHKKRVLRQISLLMLITAVIFVFCALSNPQLGQVIYIGTYAFGPKQWRICYGIYIVVMITLFLASFFEKNKK